VRSRVACAGGRAIGGDALAMQVHACSMTVSTLTDFDQWPHMHVAIARTVNCCAVEKTR
jgi:hypothetical protein